MDRISTVNLNSMTIGGAMQAQLQWAKAEAQQSSGLVSDNFAGLGGSQSNQVLSLEHEIQQAQNYSTETTNVGSRVQAMYDAVGSMSSLMTKLQTVISSAISSSDNSGLLTQVQTIQKSLIGAMNAQQGSVYLFAGSNTSVAPISTTSYPTLTTVAPTPVYNGQTGPNYYDPTTADTSYYTGDSTVLSVRMTTQQTLSYGVTANNTAFEESMRAVEAVVQTASSISSLSTSQATTALQQAFSLTSKSITDLSNLQADIAAKASTLKTSATQQTTYVTYLQNSLSSVKDVDAAQIASQVATYKTQLTASYSAVSDLSKMSLAQYL